MFVSGQHWVGRGWDKAAWGFKRKGCVSCGLMENQNGVPSGPMVNPKIHFCVPGFPVSSSAEVFGSKIYTCRQYDSALMLSSDHQQRFLEACNTLDFWPYCHLSHPPGAFLTETWFGKTMVWFLKFSRAFFCQPGYAESVKS